MNKVAIINVSSDGSTGKIARNLLLSLIENHYEATFFYGTGPKQVEKDSIRVTSVVEVYIHALLSRLTGLSGHFSNLSTSRLIRKLKSGSYDTFIILNLHGYYINENRLLSYIAQKNKKLVYIMVDEYSYLGKCAVSPVCDKFITGEGKCPNIRCYPASWFFDTCSRFLRDKKNNYKRLKHARFVGPEYVISNLKKSYLGNYMETSILDEAIDMDLYRPMNIDNLRRDLCIKEDRIIVLCVAPPYKGAHLFIELARRFKGNNKYTFIYVGKENCNKDDNVIHINYVEKDEDLARFYSMADLFVFTSMADTMSNACLESMACGTPILVFNISGMPFLLDDTVGFIVEPGNVDEMQKVVSGIRKKAPNTIETCRDYALKRFNAKEYAKKVIDIANSIK